MLRVRTLVLVPILAYFVYFTTVICPFYTDSPAIILPKTPITTFACSLNHRISKPIYAATIKSLVESYVVPALIRIDTRFGVSRVTSNAFQTTLTQIRYHNSYACRVFHNNVWPHVCAWGHVMKIRTILSLRALGMSCRIAILRLKKAVFAYTTTIYESIVFQAYKRPWSRQMIQWVHKSPDASKSSKRDFIRREWRRLAEYKDDAVFRHLAISKQREILSKVKRFLYNQPLVVGSKSETGESVDGVSVVIETVAASIVGSESSSSLSISESSSGDFASHYGATPLPESEDEEEGSEEPLTVRIVETIFVHASSESESAADHVSQSGSASLSTNEMSLFGSISQASELPVSEEIEHAIASDSTDAGITAIHPMKASIADELNKWNSRINRTFDMAAESIAREMDVFVGSIITEITDNISGDMRHVADQTQRQYAKMNKMIDDINRDYGIMQTERDPNKSLADRQAMRDLIAYTKPLTDQTSRRVQEILTEKHSLVVDEYFKVIQRNIDTLEMFADATAGDFSKALGSKLEWLEQEDPSQGPFVWKSWSDLRQLHERIFEFRDHLFAAASQYKNNKPSDVATSTIGLDQWNDFLTKVEFHLNLLVRENLEFLALVRARANLAYQAREQLSREIVAEKLEQERVRQEKLDLEKLEQERERQEKLMHERLEQKRLEQQRLEQQESDQEESNNLKRLEVQENDSESTIIEHDVPHPESELDEEIDTTTITIMHTTYASQNSSELDVKMFNQTIMSSAGAGISSRYNDLHPTPDETDQTSDSDCGTDCGTDSTDTE